MGFFCDIVFPCAAQSGLELVIFLPQLLKLVLHTCHFRNPPGFCLLLLPGFRRYRASSKGDSWSCQPIKSLWEHFFSVGLLIANFSCLLFTKDYDAFFEARENNAVYAFLGLTAPPGSKEAKAQEKQQEWMLLVLPSAYWKIMNIHCF